LLNRAQDQLFFGLMPPDDAEQPSEAELALLAGWLRGELRRHNASKLDDKLRYPDYGNYVDHEALFSGEIKEKSYSPARRQEKLLAGRVPDVPITVDAQVPDDPHKTFRQRVEMVNGANECWKCHKQMNPLGLPFEMYDDFGRFRTEEELEHPDNIIQEPSEICQRWRDT
jgi:hypothetical protein